MSEKKRRFVTVWLFLLCLFGVSAAPLYALDLEKTEDVDALGLHDEVLALVERYPDWLTYELLGYSFDRKPLYVVRLSTAAAGTKTMHLLVEAGSHAREMANPLFLVRMIEDYAQAIDQGEPIEGHDLEALSQKMTFHFLVNTNPDGFDLARFGPEKIQTERARAYLSEHVDDTDYPVFKANLRGVDLNRNFPSVYYAPDEDLWVDNWGTGKSPSIGHAPAGSFYGGPHPASEVETRIMMDYSRRYDFRILLSYHSMGRVFYWGINGLSPAFHDRAMAYANQLSKASGYDLIDSDIEGEDEHDSTGYLGHFFAYQTLKPAITVETLLYRRNGYARAGDFAAEYRRVNTLPLVAAEEALRQGYFRHKLYVKDRYMGDFEEAAYAHAFAEKMGGFVLSYPGPPRSVSTLSQEGWILTLIDRTIAYEPEKLLAFQSVRRLQRATDDQWLLFDSRIFATSEAEEAVILRASPWVLAATHYALEQELFLRKDFFLEVWQRLVSGGPVD